MLRRVHLGRRYAPNTLTSRERTKDEVRRLAILSRYEILDTPPEAPFERIAALAASLFETPIAIVGFFDGDRLWFKSHYGLDQTQVERASEGSASTLMPMIGQEFDPGFFASVPLSTRDGCDLGVLCVIDRQPHKADEYLLRHLNTLAAIVMDLLDLRISSHRTVTQTPRSQPFDSVGTAELKQRFAHLTPRQHEIMKLVVAGQPTKIIAADLGISRRTVENHRAAIMKRTGANSLPALGQLALFAA